MSPEQQKKIDKVHQISDWCIKGILLVGFVVLFLKPGKWFWWVTGILLGLAVLTNVISEIWATDEGKEEFKRTVKDAVQELESEKKAKTKTAYNGRNPLVGLDDKQTAKVHEWLNGILVENGHLKTSELVQLLRALKDRGDLDDSDKEQLILWVESITEKEVDRRNFLYDYDNKYSQTKVNKMGKTIWEEFDKLR